MGVSGITSRVITSESQRERERQGETEREREHAEPVSGFRSQAISSEWMRMPNMSHRAPTLNSEKETSRKSFSFWQPVITRALRSYLCTSVCTMYSFTPTHTHTMGKTMWRSMNTDMCLITVLTHRYDSMSHRPRRQTCWSKKCRMLVWPHLMPQRVKRAVLTRRCRT